MDDDDEKDLVERLRAVAEEAVTRLEAAKVKFGPLRDAIDHVLDEIKMLREEDEEEVEPDE